MSAPQTHPIVLKVQEHLVGTLGPPTELFDVAPDPSDEGATALSLAYFAPQGPEAPVVFATCGAALHQMADGRRIEGLILMHQAPAPSAFEAVQRLLAQFSAFPRTNPEPIQFGDVVRAQGMLQDFCGMEAVLFMPPVPFAPEFHEVAPGADESVEFVWLLPVYEAEAEYAMQHGPQALLMLFTAQGLNLTDLGRPHADTQISPEDAAQEAQAASDRLAEQTEVAKTLPPTGVQPSKVKDRRAAPAASNAGARKPAPRAHGAVKAPTKKHEVRFDLKAKPDTAAIQKKAAAKKRKPATPRPPKPEPARPLTEQEEAAAKQKRIEVLKKAAKEAEKRAAIRHAGDDPNPTAQPARPEPRQIRPRRRGVRTTLGPRGSQ